MRFSLFLILSGKALFSMKKMDVHVVHWGTTSKKGIKDVHQFFIMDAAFKAISNFALFLRKESTVRVLRAL